MHFSLAFHILTGFLCLGTSSVLAGSVSEGGSCDPANDRIDPTTKKFSSDCDDRTFCSANSTLPVSNSRLGTANSSTAGASLDSTSTSTGIPSGSCIKRLCRSTEFPFGFDQDERLPPLCRQDYFCPDRGDGCQPLLSVSSTCDMDRDYQCAPGEQWNSLASDLNFNGSICLESTCM